MTAVAARARRPGGGSASRGRAGLAGTAALISLGLRRDRIFLPVWLYIFAGSIGSTGYSFRHLYTSLAERLSLIASVQHDPSVLALSGPVSGTSAGSLVAWKVLVTASAAAGLMGIFTVVRHTRDDEEQGRLELVGAAAVGRQASLAAGLTVAFGSSLALIPLLAAVQVVLGYPFAGALALGAAVALSGCVFAAVAAVCAQLTVSARTARGLAVAVLGVAFLLRAVGDSASGASWLRWASPLGWAEQMQVYASPRWSVGVLFVVAAAALAGCAAQLAAHRDLGAGLLPARAGRPQAAGWLRSPLALAWRLQHGALLGWAAGFALAGAVFGSAARGIGPMLNTSAQARQMFIRLGGHSGLLDAYLAAVIAVMGVAAAGYAVAAVLWLHGEESERRAEPVLAAPVGRVRWAGSHLLVAAVGSAALLVLGGLAMALGDGLTSGGVGTQVPRLAGAGLAQVPAAWVMAGVAVALWGLVPRAAVATAWSALGLAALITVLGPAVRLAQAVLDVSPFTHIPKLPGAPVTATPLAWLIAVAVVLAVAGLAGFRRRDLL
ncbi:MAG: ABC transporter permease [Streptosporangiaceae bacterium]|jgi:ABC-2 type transport system permease protein